ncbi:hypothetical protein IV102_06325 [bacterium]|nr:hypothetical protein [bacterium]
MGLVQIGLSLMLLQLLLVWHLGPVFHSSELPWQTLAVGALLGQALGYWLGALKWSRALVPVASLAPLLAVALRGLSSLGPLQHNLVLRLLSGMSVAVVCSAGLAQLTVAYWNHRPARMRLSRFYALEMLGAIGALALALALGPDGSTLVYPWCVLLAAQGWVGLPTCLSLLLVAVLESLTFSQARWLAGQRAYSPALLKAQAVSPYQYVEIVEQHGQSYLFLNGLCHYGPQSVNQLNRYLAQWPAQRLPSGVQRSGCLILGAGSFVAPAYTLQAGLPTTVIELDARVVELGRANFADQWRPIHPLDGLKVVVGDARQELERQGPTGLVVINLPTPYSLNVASLFTREFFERIRGQLVPGGQLSLFLGGPLQETGLDGFEGPVVQALLQVFPHLLAISSVSCENTVILASDSPLGTPTEWRRHLRSQGQSRFRLLTEEDLKVLAAPYQPASFNNFQFCAALNRSLWVTP